MLPEPAELDRAPWDRQYIELFIARVCKYEVPEGVQTGGDFRAPLGSYSKVSGVLRGLGPHHRGDMLGHGEADGGRVGMGGDRPPTAAERREAKLEAQSWRTLNRDLKRR